MGLLDAFKKKSGATAKWTGKTYKCPRCGNELTTFLWTDIEEMAKGGEGYVRCSACGTKVCLPQ